MNDLTVFIGNPVAVFSSQQDLDGTLASIERAAFAELEGASLETARSRKIYGSVKRKVASSKVAIDDAGKALTAKKRSEIKEVDIQRKKARDFLDDLGARVREPLTTWEDAEAERIAKEAADARYLDDWCAAIQDNQAFDIRRENERKAAELAKREAEIKAKEDKAKFEAEREAREKEIAEKARADALAAQKRAEEIARVAEEQRVRAEANAKADAVAAQERAERERASAVEAARIDEQRRIREEFHAKAEKERIAEEEAEKNRQDEAHREKINAEAFASMLKNGISPTLAGKIMQLLKAGEIANVRICY